MSICKAALRPKQLQKAGVHAPPSNYNKTAHGMLWFRHQPNKCRILRGTFHKVKKLIYCKHLSDSRHFETRSHGSYNSAIIDIFYRICHGVWHLLQALMTPMIFTQQPQNINGLMSCQGVNVKGPLDMVIRQTSKRMADVLTWMLVWSRIISQSFGSGLILKVFQEAVSHRLWAFMGPAKKISWSK